MPILNTSGLEVDNTWRFVEDESPVRAEDFSIYTVGPLKALFDQANDKSDLKVGVRLHVDDDVEDIASVLPRLALVELVFSHFKDGRPFSTAVDLRRKFGFSADLRASGDILPDQALFLIRCGFSTVSVPEQFSVEQFKTALSAYSVAYQTSQNDTLSLVVGLRGSDAKAAAQ